MISIFFVALSVFWFMIGAAVGSFLNVVLHRSIKGEQWLWGRSHCDFCDQKLSWWENIPLLSFVWLRGQTRCCHRELTLAHPVVELLTGSLFVWWYWGWQLFFHLTQQPFQLLQLGFWLVAGILLLAITVVDMSEMIIPDLLVGTLLLLGLAYRVILTAGGVMQNWDFVYLLMAAAAASASMGAIWLVTRGRGLGLGDVKLVAPLAVLVGWPETLVMLLSSFVIGAVVGVGLLAMGRARLGRPMPFGPFLVVGTVVALVWGGELVSWYLSLL